MGTGGRVTAGCAADCSGITVLAGALGYGCQVVRGCLSLAVDQFVGACAFATLLPTNTSRLVAVARRIARHAVVRRFLGNRDVMRMALLY